jgi:hypothetical protein
MFEKNGLKKTFEPKKDEVNDQFKILHKAELPDLYRSPNIAERAE